MSDTRAQILEAATELFAQQGYGRTSIRQIAEKADANSALIYYYFGSKAELYRAALSEPAARLREVLHEALDEEASASERLEQFIFGYIHFTLTEMGMGVLVFRSLASGDVDLTAVMRERLAPNVALLRGIIEQGIASGEFRPVDTALAVGSLTGMVLLYVLAAPAAEPVFGVEVDEGFVERLSAHTAELFLRGLRA